MFSVQVSTVCDGEATGQSPGGRGRARSAVRMPGRISNEWERSICRVTDLSSAGARLQTYERLLPQSVVLLTLPGQPARRARIVWSDDYTAGCAFDAPLDEATLDDLVAIYGFVPAIPEISMLRG